MASNEEGLPSLKRDLQNAKLFLQQCGANGDSLFDHLSSVISKVIDERPKNVVDCFEQFSERVRLESYQVSGDLVEDAYKEPDRLAIARKALPMLIEKSKQPTNVAEDDEVSEQPLDDDDEDLIYGESPPKDLFLLQFHWNLLGIGFPRDEVFSLACSMAKLNTNATIASCRFWGKMFGLKNDYYVVECSLTESALEARIDAVEKAINIMSLEASEEFAGTPDPTPSATSEEVENDEDKGSDLRADVETYPAGWNFPLSVPESQYRPPVEVPAEEIGRGVNRCVYLVCTNLLCDEWIELPSATPHQINVARRIKKFLTGDLDGVVASYPKFPGTERNYLRALIARITAGTSISPRNFNQIGSNEDDDEGSDDADADASINNDKPIRANASYRPWPISKLLQLDYWEHHQPEILKQGRVTYFDGSVLNKNDDDESDLSFEDDEGDETETANNETQPEIPIPLFTSLSGDRLTNDGWMSPWTIRLSDVVETLVSVRSRAWPGAFAFVKHRICDTIYIGDGQKFSSTNYAPPAIPPPSTEHSSVIHEPDPTVEEEEEDEKKKQQQAPNDDEEFADEDEVDGNQ